MVDIRQYDVTDIVMALSYTNTCQRTTLEFIDGRWVIQVINGDLVQLENTVKLLKLEE